MGRGRYHNARVVDWLIVLATAVLLLWAVKLHAAGNEPLSSPAGEVIRDVYIVPDALGSPAALLDEQGEVIWRQGYSAYGERLESAGDAQATLDYTGHQRDSSGLVYMGARYYDPQIGRFLSMDPASFDPGNVQSFNRYAYANNNPYRYVDPDGELPFLVPLLIFVGKEAAGYVFEEITGIPAPTVKNLGKAALRQATKRASRSTPSRVKPKPKSENCCFVAGTPVMTEAGLKPIEQIELGELVYAADPKSGEHAYKPVTRLYFSAGRELYALTIADASGETEVLQVTDDHPFWVEDSGWVDAIALEAGMQLRGLDGASLRVVEFVALGRESDTYNLEVAGLHTFFAGHSSVLVHNCNGAEGRLTPRAARRQAMREAGIPTSQQPVSQSRNAAGREYSYDVTAPGGGTQRMSVQQQTLDRSHPGQSHFEAGPVKTDPLTGQVRTNRYGRPALTNDKVKVDY